MSQWEEKISTNDIQTYADINNLLDGAETPFPNYALCLPKYSKLDGQYWNVNSIDTGNIGYMSSSLSDSTGAFTTYPKITIEFARKKTSGGISFIFNTRSGDYPNSLTIKWYKHSELVKTQDYAPNTAIYEAIADVGPFTKAEITFKSTNKPYRYVWVALLENYKLVQAEGVKITYYDVTYKGKEKVTSITGANQSIGDVSTLTSEDTISYPYYSLCLPKYAKLDGYFSNMPASPTNMGFISTALSDADGEFTTNPTLTFELSSAISSKGLSLYQNNATGDYCTDVNVKWYNGSTLIDEDDFEIGDVDYLIENAVSNFNKIVVEFVKTSNPFRNVYIRGFDFGIIRTFDKKQIVNCNCYQEIDPISTELTINTLDFEIKNVKNLTLDFQKAQKCKLFFDKGIVGQFYITNGSRVNKDEYSIEAQDFISILDYNYHFGGMYSSKNVVDLIEEIFDGENIELNIDDSFDNVTVTGYLPYDTKRKNLAQICLAIGAIVDTSFDDSIYIFPYPTETAIEIAEGNIYANTIKLDHGDVVTGVELTVHNYTSSSTSKTLFEDTVTGTILVEFDEPMHDLSISGGTIASSSVNHAYITGTGATVTLTGQEYVHEKQIISKNSTNAIVDKKIMSVEDATLVNSSNGQTILNRLFNYYNNNETVQAEIILGDLEVSNNVEIDTYDGTKSGIIKSADMTFSGEIRAEVKIQCQDI